MVFSGVTFDFDNLQFIGLRPPLLIITMDDGRDTNVKAYGSLMARGLRGTSYINATRQDSQTNAYLGWADVKFLILNGWDIQCHTYDHTDLTTITAEEIDTNLTTQDSAFTAQGLSVPTHHAYPWGNNNAEVRATVSTHRDTMRGTADGLNDYSTIDIHNMLAVDADIQDDIKLNTVKGKIDDAVTGNKIIILYFHSILEFWETGIYSIKKSYLELLLDYIFTKKIRVATMSEAYLLFN